MSMTWEGNKCDIRTEGNSVVLEAPEINGVRGFEIHMTPQRAREVARKLIDCAIRAMPGAGSKVRNSA